MSASTLNAGSPQVIKMKEGVIEDWALNGMPCLACGERVAMELIFNGDKTKLILKGECDPCSASPIGRNPMMLMLE